MTDNMTFFSEEKENDITIIRVRKEYYDEIIQENNILKEENEKLYKENRTIRNENLKLLQEVNANKTNEYINEILSRLNKLEMEIATMKQQPSVWGDDSIPPQYKNQPWHGIIPPIYDSVKTKAVTEWIGTDPADPGSNYTHIKNM